MRISIALVGMLVASVATAEEPDVEAQLEEAAAAGAALERVLDERQPVGEPDCQGGGCGAAAMNSSRTVKEPGASRDQPVADGAAAGTGMSAGEMGGKGGMGGMGGMGKMQRGGMGKMGGMGGQKDSEDGASMGAPAASAEPPAASIPSEDPVAENVDPSGNESAGGKGGMSAMGKMQRGGMGKMGGMHQRKGPAGEGPTQPDDPGPDTDPSTP